MVGKLDPSVSGGDDDDHEGGAEHEANDVGGGVVGLLLHCGSFGVVLVPVAAGLTQQMLPKIVPSRNFSRNITNQLVSDSTLVGK